MSNIFTVKFKSADAPIVVKTNASPNYIQKCLKYNEVIHLPADNGVYQFRADEVSYVMLQEDK